MFGNIGFFQVVSPIALIIPMIIFLGSFALVLCYQKDCGIEKGKMRIKESLTGCFLLTAFISFFAYVPQADKHMMINENAQTLNSIKLEAYDLEVPLKDYVSEIFNQKPGDDAEGFWSGMGAYRSLAEYPTKSIRRADFLSSEEFKVANQYIRHCYPGEAGEAAREYMASYPVEPHIVSKKLVKAQSMVVDSDINTDCLNSVSLTFLR